MRRTLLATGLVGAVLLPNLAWAEDPIETYQARLSHADHFTSNGARLTGVAEILRQDRVNIFKYENADPDDQVDTYFKTEANRLKLEDLVAGGSISPKTRDEIIYGAPLVQVTVYRSHVDVVLKPDR